MTTNHDMAAAKIDEALSIVENGSELDRRQIAETLRTAKAAINRGRFLTAAELADRWRCSVTGIVKRLRRDKDGPAFFRPSNSERGLVLYQIDAIEEFERTHFMKGKTQ